MLKTCPLLGQPHVQLVTSRNVEAAGPGNTGCVLKTPWIAAEWGRCLAGLPGVVDTLFPNITSKKGMVSGDLDGSSSTGRAECMSSLVQ